MWLNFTDPRIRQLNVDWNTLTRDSPFFNPAAASTSTRLCHCVRR